MKKILGLLFVIVLGLTVYAAFSAAEEKAATPPPAAADSPDTVTLDSIVKLYGPVSFTHSAHVGYAGKCEKCHHHAEPGVYVGCKECHTGKPITDRASSPMGLKGAYHAQCMNCHKEMGSGPMGCTDCHEKKAQVENKKQ